MVGTSSIFENEVENSTFHSSLSKAGDHSICLQKPVWGYFTGSSHREPHCKRLVPRSVQGSENMVMVA